MSSESYQSPSHTNDDLSTPRREPPRACLIFIGSPENDFDDAGEVFRLDGLHKVRIGRAVSRELEREVVDGVLYIGVPLPWISGAHCELRVAELPSGPSLHIDDLHSRNGTLVDGKQIHSTARLEPGLVFEAGRSFWIVRMIQGRDVFRRDPSALDPSGTCNPTLRQTQLSLARLAASEIPILLSGETGTGKAFLAERVHALSGRKGPFVRFKLSTGEHGKHGALLHGPSETVFERADGGTLFLEDVGELSELGQRELAAVLASHQNRDIVPGFRLISATCRDLPKLVAAGAFRAELYSRLVGFEARVPPLRERRDDMGLLVKALARGAAGELVGIATSAFRRMLEYRWPFNVRQVSQTLTAGVILSSSAEKLSRDVLDEILEGSHDVPETVEGVQEIRGRLVRELAAHRGDMRAVASAMGTGFRDVTRWLQRFDLRAEYYRD